MLQASNFWHLWSIERVTVSTIMPSLVKVTCRHRLSLQPLGLTTPQIVILISLVLQTSYGDSARETLSNNQYMHNTSNSTSFGVCNALSNLYSGCSTLKAAA